MSEDSYDEFTLEDGGSSLDSSEEAFLEASKQCCWTLNPQFPDEFMPSKDARGDELLFVNVLEPKFRCNRCVAPLEQTAFFTCSSCSPLDDTFDLCQRCWTAEDHVGHDYFSNPASSLCCRFYYTGFARSLENRFQIFAGRRFLGTLRAGAVIGEDEDNDATEAGSYAAAHLRSYDYTTYRQVYLRARSLASWLRRRYQGDLFVCITGTSCPQWVIADVAACFAGAVSVPLHHNLGAQEFTCIIRSTGTKVIVCMLERLAVVAGLDDVLVILMDVDDASAYPPHVLAWPDVVSTPESELLPVVYADDKEELRTLFFTSGSTGAPKGTMISDRLMNGELATCRPATEQPEVDFHYDPLAYSSGRLVMYRILNNGGRLVFFSSNMPAFFRECKAARPSYFSAPPRIWNALYSEYQSRLEVMCREHPGVERAELRRYLIGRYAGQFGPRARTFATGGAPCSEQVLRWMKRVYGESRVYDGYGTTEAGSVALNGKRMVGTRCRLIDCMGYRAEDDQGQLWIQTKRVAGGYYQQEQKTDESFRDLDGDGKLWFNTGDICYWNQETDELRVIDRQKNLIKLAQACFVSPEYIEGVLLGQSEMCDALFVWALSTQESVVAVVCPNKRMLDLLGYTDNYGDPHCVMAVLSSIRKAGREAGLQGFEIPCAIHLELEPWSVDNGLLTNSFKLARVALRNKYSGVLRRLYESPAPLETEESLREELTDSQRFLQIVQRATGGREVPLDCPLAQCGVDSVALIQISSMLRAHGLAVSYKHLFSRTVAECAQQAAPPDAAAGGWILAAGAEVDLAAECRLPVDLRVGLVEPGAAKVFLTGANGFLGVYILQQLVALRLPVVCMIRAPSDAEALARLQSSLAFFNLEIALTDVECVCGDLSLDQFGWSSEKWSRIKRQISVVIHNGCRVNGVLPYSLLKATNVGGTLTCCRLCASIVYVSSTSALVSPGGYGTSKRVAEALLGAASESLGVSLYIVRPGTIGASLHTGITNTTDFVNRFFQGLLQLGIAPDSNPLISLVPVERVAEAVVGGLALGRNESQAVNVVSQGGLHLQDALRCLRSELGIELRVVEYSEWRMRLLMAPQSNVLLPLRSYFGPSGMPSMSTDASVVPSQEYPAFDEKLFILYMKHIVSLL